MITATHFQLNQGHRLEKSGMEEKLREEGFTIRWTDIDKIETKRLEGWDILYEIDEKERTRFRLVIKNELILMGKKD